MNAKKSLVRAALVAGVLGYVVGAILAPAQFLVVAPLATLMFAASGAFRRQAPEPVPPAARAFPRRGERRTDRRRPRPPVLLLVLAILSDRRPQAFGQSATIAAGAAAGNAHHGQCPCGGVCPCHHTELLNEEQEFIAERSFPALVIAFWMMTLLAGNELRRYHAIRWNPHLVERRDEWFKNPGFSTKAKALVVAWWAALAMGMVIMIVLEWGVARVKAPHRTWSQAFCMASSDAAEGLVLGVAAWLLLLCWLIARVRFQRWRTSKPAKPARADKPAKPPVGDLD